MQLMITENHPRALAGPPAVRFYLDCTAVRQEMEVVGCLFVTETHPLITTGVHASNIVFLTRRRLLRYCVQAHGAKCKQEKEVKNFHRWQIN
jgi:hypothetical protein